MGLFAYKGIDASGSLIAGVVEADTLDHAESGLSSKGLNLLSVKTTSPSLARIRTRSFSGGVRRLDVIEFVRNMSMVLKAGIPILEALEDMRQTTDNRLLKGAILDIKERITAGSTLSEALNANARVFPGVLTRIVRIGEETGRLELSLRDVANHLQRLEDLALAVKQALMYPAFVLVTTGGALIFWIVYVMPKLFAVIKEMGVALPLVTRILLALSNFSQSNWYVFLLVPLVIVIVARIARKNEATKYYLDLIKLKLPILKPFLQSKFLALFSEQMRIMVVAGLTIDRALAMASESIGSEVFRRALVLVREKILMGSRISNALREHTVFPPMVVRMVDVGESSGSLDEQLGFLSDFYFKKLDALSVKLSKTIEPVLMSIVGLVFLLMTVAMLLPIYDVVLKFK
jgi:type II secretory pathway component PulF